MVTDPDQCPTERKHHEHPNRPGHVMKAAVLEDTDWIEDAVATLIGLSRATQFFTADDLRREMRPAPHPNMVGVAFAKARNTGHIEAVTYRSSDSATRKRGVLRTWTAARGGR